MLVSPRKQKATVRGGGGAAGTLWAAVRAGPGLLPLSPTDKRGQEDEVAYTSCLTTRGQLRGAPTVLWLAHCRAAPGPCLSRYSHSEMGARQARPVLCDHVPSCPFTGLSFFI